MVVSGVPNRVLTTHRRWRRWHWTWRRPSRGCVTRRGHGVGMRIGLASGPVVAGVVGSRRFFYDVWGDAVNVASRMESTDPTGRIQVPQNVYERLRDEFAFTERGDVDVKGKGMHLVPGRPAGDIAPGSRRRDGVAAVSGSPLITGVSMVPHRRPRVAMVLYSPDFIRCTSARRGDSASGRPAAPDSRHGPRRISPRPGPARHRWS